MGTKGGCGKRCEETAPDSPSKEPGLTSTEFFAALAFTLATASFLLEGFFASKILLAAAGFCAVMAVIAD